MVKDGTWGDWKDTIAQGDAGSFLCGFESTWQYDIGMDGLKGIFCSATNWATQKSVQAVDKQSGTWKSVKCPQDSFVIKFHVRYLEDSWTVNETGMEGLEIECKNPYTQATY